MCDRSYIHTNTCTHTELFAIKKEKESARAETVTVKLVFVEIYNENVRDLLVDKDQVSKKDRGKAPVCVHVCMCMCV